MSAAMSTNAPARTCCVWCIDWPVVALRRRDPALRGVPVAVRERDGSRELVRAASAEARAEGVTRGMRRREAEARCPGIAIVDADLALEARAFEVVARAVETLTPRVVLERPGVCAFPTRGPARYFGGDHGLARRTHEVVSGVLGEDRDDVRVAVADGAFAARLATRRASATDPYVVAVGSSPSFVAPLPVSVLGDDALADLLRRLGLHTLGDFAALSTDAVLARFGTEGRRLHDLARGLDSSPPVLVEPPADLVVTVELDPPAARVDTAAFAAKGLADRLLAQLAERGLACTRVVIEAETEHGERLSRCWRHDGALTPGTLAERVRWQLDGWLSAHAAVRDSALDGDVREQQDADAFADAGLDAFDTTTGALTKLALVPDEVVPADGRQLGFWGGDQVGADRADRALARVQGMLGFDAVTTIVVQGGRTSAEQVRWVPWGEPREPERPLTVDGEVPSWPGAVPCPAPARVFEPPVRAQLLDDHGRPVVVSGRGEQSAAPARLHCNALPAGGGRVVAWAGPWALDVRWWDVSQRRRCARWQVVVDHDGEGEPCACLVAVEGGAAVVEALYD
jgi:protein ImuB